MISPDYLSEAFDRNVNIIKKQTEGLSQSDSLIQLPFRSNCLNWVVGHIITNRYQVIRLLDGVAPYDAGRMKRYERESEPITGPGDGVLEISRLLMILEATQAEISLRLEALTVKRLDQSVAFYGNKSQRVAEWLFFFYFHDTYHSGQTELLRQAAGKDDKVI